MERTIAIVGGGDLVIEDSVPPIEGVLSGTIKDPGQPRYSFMLSSASARRLVDGLRSGEHVCVNTFTGRVSLWPPVGGNDWATLRFHAFDSDEPEHICGLYEGAIEAAADALAEAAGKAVAS